MSTGEDKVPSHCDVSNLAILATPVNCTNALQSNVVTGTIFCAS